MRRDCDVCFGRGKICLPVFQRVCGRVGEDAANPLDRSRNYREYPCPECSNTVAWDRVAVVNEFVEFPAEDGDAQKYIDWMGENVVRQLIWHLLKKGLIAFEVSDLDETTRTRRMRAALGVVAPNVVATMDQRVADRQDEVAKEVAEEACRRISVWGSEFHGDEGFIRKAQARQFVQEALDAVLQRRAKRKAA